MLLAATNSGHADHRPAGPRARAAHQPARARLGDPRLHDRLDRARAHRRPAVRPVRPQARVRRRLPGVLAGLARRRLRGGRHAADRVADPAGDRRGVPVRERGRARHRRVPAASSSAWRWGRTRWSPRSGSCSARCSAARWSRSRGSGCSGSTCRSASAAAAWGAFVLHELVTPDDDARARPRRRGHVRRRAHRARPRRLEGRHRRLERPGRDRRAGRRRGAAAGLRRDRAPRSRADARPVDLPQPAVRRRDRARRSSTASRASR